MTLASCEKPPAQGGSTAEQAVTSGKLLLSDEALRDEIDSVLNYTQYRRELDSRRHAAWQILHGVLAYGRDFEITHDGQSVNTIDWVFQGGDLNGWTMQRGKIGLKAVLEPGTKTGQGHEDQWLAVLSQCDLPLDQEIRVGNGKYTMKDLVRQTQYDVVEGKECSWTLIGLTQYVPLDAEWKSVDGSTWNFDRLIGMEAGVQFKKQEDKKWHINGDVACGGSHRLIGLTMALERYRKQHPELKDEDLTGGWKAAHEQIQWAIETARRNQLPDGAFSINYFRRSSNSPDKAEHLGATGHTLEFLALALDKEQLREEWVTRAAEKLCELFKMTQQLELECGALYHAAHGLVLYREKRFGAREDNEDTVEEETPSQAPESEQTTELKKDTESNTDIETKPDTESEPKADK